MIRRLSLGDEGTLIQDEDGCGDWKIDLTKFRHKTSKCMCVIVFSCFYLTATMMHLPTAVYGPSITTLSNPVARMLEDYLEMEGRKPGACSFEFTERDTAVNRADKEYL